MVKWCSECSDYEEHLTANHQADQGNIAKDHVDEEAGHVAMDEAFNGIINDDATAAFTRLRLSRLL